jgi:hypothetical protein
MMVKRPKFAITKRILNLPKKEKVKLSNVHRVTMVPILKQFTGAGGLSNFYTG